MNFHLIFGFSIFFSGFAIFLKSFRILKFSSSGVLLGFEEMNLIGFQTAFFVSKEKRFLRER